MRGAGRVIAIVAVVVVAAVGGWFAGRHALAPAGVPAAVTSAEVTVKVGQADLGRSIELNVVAMQPRIPVATNLLSGVVTKVSPAGTFASGAVLYAVAGVPVRPVVGSEPFYRDLTVGVSGADVGQLTAALTSLKLLDAPTDTFSVSVGEAVKAWQRQLKAPVTGVVKLGELVALPTLPAALTFDSKVLASGAVLSGGEKVVLAAAGEPTFDLIVSNEQARLIPQSATVVVTHQSTVWTGMITGQEADDQGQTILHLGAKSGGVLCGAECSSLSIGDQLTLPASIELVPKVSGPSVPVAAISTDGSGQATVQLVGPSGKVSTTPVTVKASQDGVAVVDGVQVGQSVKMFAATADQPSTEPSK